MEHERSPIKRYLENFDKTFAPNNRPNGAGANGKIPATLHPRVNLLI